MFPPQAPSLYWAEIFHGIFASWSSWPIPYDVTSRSSPGRSLVTSSPVPLPGRPLMTSPIAPPPGWSPMTSPSASPPGRPLMTSPIAPIPGRPPMTSPPPPPHARAIMRHHHDDSLRERRNSGWVILVPLSFCSPNFGFELITDDWVSMGSWQLQKALFQSKPFIMAFFPRQSNNICDLQVTDKIAHSARLF